MCKSFWGLAKVRGSKFQEGSNLFPLKFSMVYDKHLPSKDFIYFAGSTFQHH